MIDFDVAKTVATDDAGPVAIPFVAQDALRHSSADRGSHPQAAEDLRALAAELEGNGQLQQATEVYRAILFSGESTAEDHFALAELLYLGNDLSAARERYYVAIELDEDFVEARSNLGCVLAEQGETDWPKRHFAGRSNIIQTMRMLIIIWRGCSTGHSGRPRRRGTGNCL